VVSVVAAPVAAVVLCRIGNRIRIVGMTRELRLVPAPVLDLVLVLARVIAEDLLPQWCPSRFLSVMCPTKLLVMIFAGACWQCSFSIMMGI
jgi:hypothetical protein